MDTDNENEDPTEAYQIGLDDEDDIIRPSRRRRRVHVIADDDDEDDYAEEEACGASGANEASGTAVESIDADDADGDIYENNDILGGYGNLSTGLSQNVSNIELVMDPITETLVEVSETRSSGFSRRRSSNNGVRYGTGGIAATQTTPYVSETFLFFLSAIAINV